MKKITLALICAFGLVFAHQAQAQSSLVGSNPDGTIYENGPAGTASGVNQRGGGPGPVVITHSNTQNITSLIACNDGVITLETSFFRDFDLANDFGIENGFEVANAEFGVGEATQTYDVTVNIWSSDGAFPDGALELLASEDYTVGPADVGNVVSVPIQATIPAGMNMVYQILAPNDGATLFFLGTNLDGQTGPSWIQSADCGAPDPTDLADFGLFNSYVMNVVGFAVTNDECEDAFPIACGETLSGDTTFSSDSNGTGGPDQWWTFTSSNIGEEVTVSLCGGAGFDTRLRIYDGCGGTELFENDDACGLQSEITFTSDGSSTYYIAVDGFGGGSFGPYDLSVTCIPLLEGDLCTSALPLSCGETVMGSTVGMTSDDEQEVCGDKFVDIGTGVWYTFTDDFGFPSDYTLTMCNGTDYDSSITVYTGDDCSNLVCVTGNDDFCGLQSEVSFTGDGSSTYYVLVHGFGGSTGNYTVDLSCTPIPPPNDDIENAIDVDQIGFPYTDPAVAMPAATTEDGNPVDCAIDGANGVWYKWTATEAGFAEGEIVSPAGFSTVIFFRAPDENAEETDLIHIQNGNNQCLPSTTASILTTEGRTYYAFVVNQGGGTDINLNAGLLGVEENGIEGFSFSPNPASDVLNISALDVIERATVYNILGQTVIDRSIDATSSQLNVSSLSVGTYIMKVTVNGQVGTYKIVKQ